jgi:hypothetical protein
VPRVFGILSLAIGTAVLTIAFFAVASALTASRWNEGRLIVLAYGMAQGAMATWLLVIGVGQVRYQRWARQATRLWSFLMLAFLVASPILLFVLTGFRARGAAGVAGMSVAAFFYQSAYPIVCLCLFRTYRVRQAMIH